MLALAEELQNISVVCKRAGISRSHYYEIKQAFENFGSEGLAPAATRASTKVRKTLDTTCGRGERPGRQGVHRGLTGSQPVRGPRQRAGGAVVRAAPPGYLRRP